MFWHGSADGTKNRTILPRPKEKTECNQRLEIQHRRSSKLVTGFRLLSPRLASRTCTYLYEHRFLSLLCFWLWTFFSSSSPFSFVFPSSLLSIRLYFRSFASACLPPPTVMALSFCQPQSTAGTIDFFFIYESESLSIYFTSAFCILCSLFYFFAFYFLFSFIRFEWTTFSSTISCVFRLLYNMPKRVENGFCRRI